jgi:hypothetical protein
VGERVLAVTNFFWNQFFSRLTLDESLFRRDAETNTPEARTPQIVRVNAQF